MWESIKINKHIKDQLIHLLSRHIEDNTSTDTNMKEAYNMLTSYCPDIKTLANTHGIVRLEYHYFEFNDVRAVFTVNIINNNIFYDGLVPISQIYRLKGIDNLILYSAEYKAMVEKINNNMMITPLTPAILMKHGFIQNKNDDAFANVKNPYWVKSGILLFYTENPPENTYLLGTGFTYNGIYLASTMRWITNEYELFQAHYAITGKNLPNEHNYIDHTEK